MRIEESRIYEKFDFSEYFANEKDFFTIKLLNLEWYPLALNNEDGSIKLKYDWYDKNSWLCKNLDKIKTGKIKLK